MWAEIIYLGVGFFIGVVFCLDRVKACENRTQDQINGDVLKENELLKNLNNSLKDDVAYLRKKLAALNNK